MLTSCWFGTHAWSHLNIQPCLRECAHTCTHTSTHTQINQTPWEHESHPLWARLLRNIQTPKSLLEYSKLSGFVCPAPINDSFLTRFGLYVVAISLRRIRIVLFHNFLSTWRKTRSQIHQCFAHLFTETGFSLFFKIKKCPSFFVNLKLI